MQLPTAAELETLGTTLPRQLKRKNVSYHPEADRVWKSKGAFPALFEKYGREAELYGDLTPSLERGLSRKARTSFLNGLAKIGLPLAPLLDSSPCDRVMRKFHNYMKDTPAFQQTDDSVQTFNFEPYCAWMVLTDMVSHASYSGQHALVYTGLISLQNCRLQDLAPFNILRAAA